MEKNHRGTFLAWFRIFRRENLRVNLQAVRRLEEDLLWHSLAVGGKVFGPSFRCQNLRGACRKTADDGSCRMRGIRSQISECVLVTEHNRAPFHSLASRPLDSRVCRDVYTPKMPAVDVVTIRIEQDSFLVGGE